MNHTTERAHWRRAPSIAIVALLAACLDVDGADSEGAQSGDQEPVVVSEKQSAPLRARTIAQNYQVPNGIQGFGDAQGFEYGFKVRTPSQCWVPIPQDPDQCTNYPKRINQLGDSPANPNGWGASMGTTSLSWSSIDLVDEFGNTRILPPPTSGQAPCTYGTPGCCVDDPGAPGARRTPMRFVPNGDYYCVSLGALDSFAESLNVQHNAKIQNSVQILNAPRHYSDPRCLAVASPEPGVANPCAPTEQARVHFSNFIRFIASYYSRNAAGNTPNGLLTDIVLFNEVSHSDYYNIHGKPRADGSFIDVRTPLLSEADRIAWGDDYADLMNRAHDAIMAAGRRDMMLWTSFDGWFRDQYHPSRGWYINNQYILDAVKRKLGHLKDWGISIHPYGDPSPYARTDVPTPIETPKLGTSPSRYVFGNLTQLSQQMADWLRPLVPAGSDLQTYPQLKILATEQAYWGPRFRVTGQGCRREEDRRAEWICRSHDTALRNPSIIGVTHHRFQQNPVEQLAEERCQDSAGVETHGLLPSWIWGNYDLDWQLKTPAVGTPLDVTHDNVPDGTARDTNGDGVADDIALYAGGSAAPETRVRDAYRATFRKGGWGQNNTHYCCAKFNLGCATTPNAKAQIRIDPMIERDHTLIVTGRACAPGSDAPVPVDVYIDGTYIGGVVANRENEAWYDVNPPQSIPMNPSQPLTCGSNHTNQRFFFPLTRALLDRYQNKAMQFYAVSPLGVASANSVAATEWVPHIPTNYNEINGYVESVALNGDLVTARGWACAKGARQSIQVDVYNSYSADSTKYVKTIKADLESELAVLTNCAVQPGSPYRKYRFEAHFTRAELLGRTGPLTFWGLSPFRIQDNRVLTRAADFQVPSLPATYQAAGRMNGWVDQVNTDMPGLPLLTGWACRHYDSTQPPLSSIRLHVYSGDATQPYCGSTITGGCRAFIKEVSANTAVDPSLRSFCGAARDIFSFSTSFSEQEHRKHAGRNLLVYALHPSGAGPNPVLPKRTPGLALPAAPGPQFVFNDLSGLATSYEISETDVLVTRSQRPALGACDPGYVNVGSLLTPSGFWLCARADLARRTFYVGDVESNAGLHYRVSNGVVTALPSQSWNYCQNYSTYVGRFLDPNGFWLCQE